jgi:hypothetical protein
MGDPAITYFPVGNGDTVLIQLSDQTSILVDCNVTEDSRDKSIETRYDVHSHLLAVLQKDNGDIPHLGAFILTHPDEDHCRGFGETFYIGPPSDYTDSDEENGLIIVDELWFAPGIFSPHDGRLCESAKTFLKEAKRRIKLFKSEDPDRNKPGNRIRVIGYSDNENLEGLEDVITVPGTPICLINGKSIADFSFFVHAPFRKDTDSKWSERNDTSIVLQAKFDVDGVRNAGLAFLGGDAGWPIWEDILDRSEEKDLRWDLFLAPHHCSWTFFNDTPYEENRSPREKPLELLSKGMEGSMVVASCKPIKDDGDNPPHFSAKEQYVKAVGRNNFFVTMEHPSQTNPRPLRFEMSRNGPVKMDAAKGAAEYRVLGTIAPVVGRPQLYG